MTVGEKIKAIRIDKGYTQKKLGELTGIAESTIRRYELGKLNPKKETIERIANGLGVTPFELLGAEWFDIQIGAEGLAQLREDVASVRDMREETNGAMQVLLNAFATLNKTGQEKALEYILDLAEQPKYCLEEK